jgi:pyrroloquinoline quinone biosynthesis protein E
VIDPPLALLAELTHRCPLRCPYCSNPKELTRAAGDLTGGEPPPRRDIAELVAAARAAGLYTNLITAGVLLDAALMARLVEAGLDHVQLSVQDAEEAGAERIGGMKGAMARKQAAAALVKESGLPLTLNAVVHRQNLHNLPRLIEIALEWGAGRIEVAHVQYYGWALENRATLLPTRAQLDEATRIVEAARAHHKGRLVIDYVIPDYYAARPKPCMGGWGNRFLAISPAGNVLPCHAAESITGMVFPNIRGTSLRAAWEDSEAFNRFRGTAWMPSPCQGCEHAERDWGGCRCQAFALIGDAAATDPACALSPHHALLGAAIAEASASAFIYREFSAAQS